MFLSKLFLLIFVVIICFSCIEQQAEKSVQNEREVIDPRCEDFLNKMEIEEHFTGVALVMRKGEMVHAKGYGMANSKRENSVKTAFHIASITKQFTAAAILQLVEKGLVKLEVPINGYLPKEYRSPKWDSVTLHHLLSHTSGITDYAVTRDYYEVVKGFCLGNTVDGMVKEAMRKDLEFKPGFKFSYSNIGYTLLGFIIENQTNIHYNEYLKVNIFDPMGMNDSKIHIIGHIPTIEEAEGYRWSTEQNLHVPDDVVSLPVTEPDGGLVTTLTDFTKWVGIYQGKNQNILDQKSLDMMTFPYIGIDEDGIGGTPRSYGYGLVLTRDLICHEGYIVGFRSYFLINKKNKILIAVFTNNTANNPKRISAGLLNVLGMSDSTKQ
jgi:CubicO group peptidase (beta-lactamase class C family)